MHTITTQPIPTALPAILARLSLTAALALSGSLQARLGAAELGQVDATLEIHHRKEPHKLSASLNGRPLTIAKDGSIPVRLHRRERLQIVIADPNVLLFNYALGERVDTESEDFKALIVFAKALHAALSPSKAESDTADRSIMFAGQEMDEKPIHPRFSVRTNGRVWPDVAALVQSARTVAAKFSSIPELIEASLSDEEPESFVLDPEKTLDLLDFVEAASQAALRGETVEFALQEPPTADAGTDTKPRSWTAYLAEDWGAKTADGPEVATLARQLQGLFLERVRIVAMAAVASDFAAAYADYRKHFAEPVALDPIALEPGKDTSQKVAVSKRTVPGATKESGKHQDDHAGEFTVNATRAQWVHFRAGLGALYSFVRSSDYAAEQDEDGGTFTIAETSVGNQELSGVIALNLYPDRFWEEDVRLFGQIGYAPGDHKQGIILGVGFDAYEKLTLAAGLIYQERNRLDRGQHVGDTLASKDDLAVGTEFHPGLYLQVGFGF